MAKFIKVPPVTFARKPALNIHAIQSHQKNNRRQREDTSTVLHSANVVDEI
jgi:hypothetical protein